MTREKRYKGGHSEVTFAGVIIILYHGSSEIILNRRLNIAVRKILNLL